MIRDPNDIETVARLEDEVAAKDEQLKLAIAERDQAIAERDLAIAESHPGPRAHAKKSEEDFEPIFDHYFNLVAHHGWGRMDAMKAATAGTRDWKTLRNRRSAKKPDGSKKYSDAEETDQAIEETIRERAEEHEHLAKAERDMVLNDDEIDPDVIAAFWAKFERDRGE